MVALDPHTGRVLAMSGGFSFRQSKFNRATQARRQPGSAFKPFVYLAGLEQGLTPASSRARRADRGRPGPGPAEVAAGELHRRLLGADHARVGLEKSRNLCPCAWPRRSAWTGSSRSPRRLGIGEGLQPRSWPALLGANEVTPIELTAAYAMLVNGGKRIEPVLVERIQDRHGRTDRARATRAAATAAARAWDGSLPPACPTRGRRWSIRATPTRWSRCWKAWSSAAPAEAAQAIGKPLAGKTGTTNESKDAWFVGFSPDLVVGVFVGFDQPRGLGEKETGATVALPIWIEVMAPGAGRPAGRAVPHPAGRQPRPGRRRRPAACPARQPAP